MIRNRLWILAMLLLPATASAAPPNLGSHSIPRAPAIFDYTTHMDANNLDMVVTNFGSFAYDLLTGNAGLTYPKGTARTVVFAAGPWIGAKVEGETRIATGQYLQAFVPGPMRDGTFQPDQADFKSYKIERGNTTSPDYLNWPTSQGAPLDKDGKPLLLGDVTIWSVYNDADPSRHGAVNTLPLGIEIQQTTFAFNRSGALGNVIFLRFKVSNKGESSLEDVYFSLWSDPDLGDFRDDLAGCDTTLSMGYCYNATNSDAVYGAQPPAVGFCLLRGPAVPASAGVYDTLGMSSFISYSNGGDPFLPDDYYNYMRGLHTDGTPIHVYDDPGRPTSTYQTSGDPVTGTGWLDSDASDRRMMLSTGPFALSPGRTQEIAVAILVGQGSDRLSSVSDLRNAARVAKVAYRSLFPEEPGLEAGIDLDPDTINLNSHAPWVTAYVEPPGSFSPTDIDVSTVRLAGSVAADPKFAVAGGFNSDGKPVLKLRFSRQALDPLLAVGMNQLEVTGSLVTGQAFKGSDEVRVINPPGAGQRASVTPNPLNPVGVLAFSTARSGPVTIKLYDLQGTLVRTLIQSQQYEAGQHDVLIDGKGEGSQPLASGVYFFRVEGPGRNEAGRVAILK